jgi:hypothetical protein
MDQGLRVEITENYFTFAWLKRKHAGSVLSGRQENHFEASFSFDPSSANAIRIGMNGVYLVRAPCKVLHLGGNSLGRTHITANEHCSQKMS